MSERRCPNCSIALRPVTARATSGYALQLDQCGRCGGVWCDRWELFPIDAGEVARLDPADQSALWAPVTSAAGELQCPRCHAAMQRFHDRLLPEDVLIERCPACEGMWLNRGELRRFKAHGTPPPRPQILSDEPIQQLVQAYGTTANWPTVPHLDDAATAPPLPDDESPGVKRDLIWGAAWLGLRVVMRLLLHL